MTAVMSSVAAAPPSRMAMNWEATLRGERAGVGVGVERVLTGDHRGACRSCGACDQPRTMAAYSATESGSATAVDDVGHHLACPVATEGGEDA